MVMTPVTLFLLSRLHLKPPLLLAIGFTLVAVANVNTAQVLTTDSSFGTFVVPLVVGGLGFGMLFVPLSVAVLGSVGGADTQKATSLLSLCQQLGGSVCAAFLVTLLDRRTAFHLNTLAGGKYPAEPGGGASVAAARGDRASCRGGESTGRYDGLCRRIYVLGAVTLLLTPLVLFSVRREGRRPRHLIASPSLPSKGSRQMHFPPGRAHPASKRSVR